MTALFAMLAYLRAFLIARHRLAVEAAALGGPGLNVYGFNGKHLGWFVNGVIWDKHGEGACAVKERLQSTQAEPFKMSKQLRPLKAVKNIVPFRPAFSDQFGHMPCGSLLTEGEGLITWAQVILRRPPLCKRQGGGDRLRATGKAYFG